MLQQQQSSPRAWAVLVGLSCLAIGTVARPIDVPTDREITQTIEAQYLRDDAIVPIAIETVTKDGIVTLSGSAPSLLVKRRAAEVAESVRGVRAVVNRIEVSPNNLSTEEITEAVSAKLANDPIAREFAISAATDKHGTVTLTGEVDSWTERELVEKLAMTARGVRQISNEIELRMTQAFRHEIDITQDVEARLHWDTLVDDSLIEVLVLTGGRVMLSGTVGSAAEKNRAHADAWVAGVRSVDTDHLKVEPWARNDNLRRDESVARPDSEIRAAIRKAFTYDPRVLRQNVAVDVQHGRATLTGSVDNLPAKHAANQDAMNTVGVTSVDNELRVVPVAVSDAEIESLLVGALRGARLLDGNDIDVTVDDGVIGLNGDLATSSDYWQAAELAYGTRGAVEVANHMTVNGRVPKWTSYWYGRYPTMTNLHTGESVPTDREIRANVESELFWSPFVDGEQIDVTVDRGIVTLDGTVSSTREWRAARENAFEGGALGIDDELVLAQ